jgi:hypothetical protein
MFVGESADRDDPDGRAALVIIQGGIITDRIALPCASIYEVVPAPMAAMEGLRRGFGTNPQRVAGASTSRLMTEVGERGILGGVGSPLRPDATATRSCVSRPRPCGPVSHGPCGPSSTMSARRHWRVCCPIRSI